MLATALAATAQGVMAGNEDMPIPLMKLKGGGYPDFSNMVTQEVYAASYKDQPIFSLKADFPTQMPAKIPEFMKRINFKENPKEYLRQAQLYAFEGNLRDFGSKSKVDWVPFGNPVRNWFHIPWLHPSQGPNGFPPNGGTEGFHGLIKEAQVQVQQLSGTQLGTYQVYAITLINENAGYTMGRMWKDPNNPDPCATDRRCVSKDGKRGGFALGTVFAKLLFTDAPGKAGDDPSNPTDHVDYLQNNVEWDAYITENWNSTQYAVKKVRLLQMDMMMRDPRADRSPNNPSGTGWVFGTFAYNGAVNNPKSKFLNLVPLGVSWGNDPENKVNKVNPYPPVPVAGIINTDLHEQKVFDDVTLPPQHLGWNSRLNGPADLNTSSCISCHNMGEYPSFSSLVAPGMVPPGLPTPPVQGGTAAWMKYFQNQLCATPYDREAYSTDMSMQVMISLQNFYTTKGNAENGRWATEYQGRRAPNSPTR